MEYVICEVTCNSGVKNVLQHNVLQRTWFLIIPFSFPILCSEAGSRQTFLPFRSSSSTQQMCTWTFLVCANVKATWFTQDMLNHGPCGLDVFGALLLLAA